MRSSGLRDGGVFLLGASVGAGLMMLIDPKGGARRRSLARDQIVHFGRTVIQEVDKRGRDLIQRARGSAYEMSHRGEHVDDDTLVERVRAQIGHVVSHPGALEMEVHSGCVVVRGPVIRGERDRILDRLNKTRGVQQCDLSAVVEHDSASSIPGLQGQSHSRRKFA